MNKVTKEWLWILAAILASLLSVVFLIGSGIRPDQSLPMAFYVIVFPVALVYLVRFIFGAVKMIRKKRP